MRNGKLLLSAYHRDKDVFICLAHTPECTLMSELISQFCLFVFYQSITSNACICSVCVCMHASVCVCVCDEMSVSYVFVSTLGSHKMGHHK